MKTIIQYIYAGVVAAILFGCTNSLNQEQQDADAVYLNVEEDYELNGDGSQKYLHSHQLKLQSHAAFNSMYGESFVKYNPRFQKLRILRAQTQKSDGKIVVSGDNALNLMLPGEAQHSKAHNNLREMVVTHLATEIGAVLNLDYQIESSANYSPALMGDLLLAKKSPVQKMTVRIKVPEGEVLNYKLFNIEGEPDVVKEGDVTVYKFSFSNLPAQTNEPMVDYHRQYPRLVFSTGNAEQIMKWVKQEVVGKRQTSSQIKQLADDATKGCDKIIDKVLAIHKLVLNNMAWIKVSYPLDAYRSRGGEECWQSGSATKVEKSGLFAEMLKSQGVNAELVAIMPKSCIEKGVVNLATVNDFLVKVELPTGPCYISAVNNITHDMQYDGFGNVAMGMESGNIYQLKSDVNNSIVMSGEFNLNNKNLIRGNVDLLMEGGKCPYFAIHRNSKAASRFIHFDGKKSTAVDSLANERVKINYELVQAQPIEKLNSYFFWELPWCEKGINSFNIPVLTKERVTHCELPDVLHENYQYKIQLPKGVRLVNQDFNIHESSPVADLVLSLRHDGNNVLVKRELTIKKREVSRDEYENLYKILNIWRDGKYNKLIFCQI